MSYLVFARKYRPQTFAEILGQGPIVTTLTNAIRKRRIAHAYLFSGPRGTGKTSTARIFAKAINCTEGPTPTPCLKCSLCQEITEGRSLDVLEIDGASNRGIDQIRTLRDLAKFTPVSGTFKLYIIDEVHQITAEGFNALLKILEEPPPHVIFILATTAPHKVPVTILSRCQRYDFKRLSLEVIAGKVKGIAGEEHLEISEEAVLGVTRAASGSLRDAESLLDQVAAFTGGRIRREDLETLLGTIDEDVFAEAMTGIQGRDPVKLLRLVAEATNAGTDLIQWTLSFLSFLRNLLVVKVGAGPAALEELGPESIQRLAELAKGFSVEELGTMAQVLTKAMETMRRVGEPRIPLETALIRLSTGESVVAVAELLDRLDQLSERLEGKSLQPPPISASPASPVAQGSKGITLEQVVAIWPNLLVEIHRQKASTAAYLSEASPIALEAPPHSRTPLDKNLVEETDPPHIVVGFPKGLEFHRDALEHPASRQLIDQTMTTLLGCPVRCSFRIVAELPQRAAQESMAPGLEGEGASTFKVDSSVSSPPAAPDPSLVDSALKLFEGQILSEGA